MKAFFRAFCLMLICSVAVTANCAESYRTHFDVNVKDETGNTGVGGPFDVVSGVPLTFDMGKNILSLIFSVEPPPSDEYSLTVSLSPKEKSINNLNTPVLTQTKNASNNTMFTQTFHSKLVGGQNGPLEFEMEQNGFKVSGAVALSLIHNGPTN